MHHLPGRKPLARAIVGLTVVAWAALLARDASMMNEMDVRHAASDLSGVLVQWLLMLSAMMLPILAVPVKHVYDRSLKRHRFRSVGLFVLAYFAIWSASGVLVAWLSALSHSRWLIFTLACFIVLIWHCSPGKQRCLNRCHALPSLCAFGLRADVDALGFGLRHGTWCMWSCLPLMISITLLPEWHLVTMAAVAVWIFAERLELPRRPVWSCRVPLRLWRMACANVPAFLSGGANRLLLTYEAKPVTLP